MAKILIVDDYEDMVFMTRMLVEDVCPGVEVKEAYTLDMALPLVAWADLVITDHTYPTSGFPGLLPLLRMLKRKYILQTAEPDHIRMHDPELQLAAVYKGLDFNDQMTEALGLFTA